MPVLEGDIINIHVGATEIIAVHDADGIIWPRSYVFTLVPTWTYAGNYGLTTIPARGGTAYATWTLSAKRAGTVVYTATVTPTSTSISDTTNFSYAVATGTWQANDRGSNGYTSGTTSPTSAQWDAPARSCTLNASYVGDVTINGQTVSVNVTAETVTMTQARNNAQYVSSRNTYDNFSVWLDNYYDSSHQAPACESATEINGSCRCGNYIKWASDSIEYYYETLGTFYFTFSSTASWIQISDEVITVSSRWKNVGDQRTATIVGQLNQSWYPGVSGSGSATLYQKANAVSYMPATCSSLSITGYKVGGSTISEISPCTQTTVTCTFKATWREAGTKWTAYDDGDSSAAELGTLHTNDTTITPSTDLSVVGADSTTETTFTVTNVHTLSKKLWEVEATYLGKEASSSIYQVADSKTYGATKDYSVTIAKSNDTVWAGGGSATLTLYAWHTAYDYWNSGGASDVVSGSAERKNDYASASVNSGGTRFTLSSRSTGTDGSGYRYSTYTVTHTDMTNNETTDSVVYIAANDTQNPSSRPTVSLSATNARTYGTPVFVAKHNGSTTTSIEAYQYNIVLEVTCPITWTSLYPDPGLTTGDFQLFITQKANDGYRTYSSISSSYEMTFGSLERNTRSAGTTSFRAENIHTANATLSLTEKKNDRGQGTVISDTPGPKVTDSTYQEYDYSNYSLAIALSQYSSSASAAPFAAATYNGIFSCTASGHKERTMTTWHQDHTMVTKYTWDSLLEDTETTYPRETGIDEGSWGSVSDTPTITPAQSWLSISGSNVTVGANSGLARSCVINASVARLDGGSAITNSVTFYQKKYVYLSVDVSSLGYTADGGDKYISVTYTNVAFTITHATSISGRRDPVSAISPTSGGQTAGTGSTNVKVTASQNLITPPQNLGGIITITPESGSGLNALEVEVAQAAYNAGELRGTSEAQWQGATSNSIKYYWSLANTGNITKTAKIRGYVKVTTSANPTQAEIEQASTVATIYIPSISVSTVTVPPESSIDNGEGQTQTIYGRDTSKHYWIAIQGVSGTTITYEWTEILNAQ